MTIRIGIDGRAMGGNVRDGLSNVSCNYFLHFPEIEDVEFIVFSPHQRLFPEIEHCRPYKLVGASGFRKGWFYTKLPFLLQRYPVDIFWSPLQALPFGIPRETKTVVTVHDFAYLKYPETMPALRRWNLKFLAGRSIRRADLLVAISQSTAKDLGALYGGNEKTVVIYNGVDQGIFYPEKDFSSVLRGKGLEPGRYFLVVGSLEPRKNLQVVFDAATEFLREISESERPKFAFVYGNSWYSDRFEDQIRRGILTKGDSIPLNRITADLLRNLYSHALALLFPSVYEGFGLPIVEAMACGCPVIASDIPVFREICQNSCILLDANNSESFRNTLKTTWEGKGTKLKTCVNKWDGYFYYNWSKSSSRLLNTILSLVGKN